MLTTAPLDKLYKSELNVRKTDPEFDVEIFALDIAQRGLLQNLVVVDEGAGGGRLGVVAGGRRLLALQLLDAQGAFPSRLVDREAIPILMVARDQGREDSLSENVQKVAMNPVDEFVGYAQIIADYEAQGIADPHERLARCARHFNKTVRHIEQRLRLADLAPDILEALRTGAITLDAAKAYASVHDQALQMQVYAAQENGCASNRHSVQAIRAGLAGKVYRTGDRQVRYVGIEAYLAAGGRLDRDLFMGAEDQEVVLDTALVDRLAREKAEAEARERGTCAGFSDGHVKPWGGLSFHLPKPPPGYVLSSSAPQLTPKERASAIAIYELAEDGSRLAPHEHLCFVEAPPPSPATARQDPGHETEIERLARIRREGIEATALRLAFPTFEGTPFEGRAFWPPAGARAVDAVQVSRDAYAVAILVTVPKADVAAVMGQAERLYDNPGAAAAQPPSERHSEDGFEQWPIRSAAPARELVS